MTANRQERIVLTFDVGTQSARAMLINNQGEILGKKQEVYNPAYYSPEPGWAEQDANLYYDVICRCAKALKESLPKAFERVEGVSITAIRDTFVCVDEEGTPLRPAIVWLDKRFAKGECTMPDQLREALTKMGLIDGFNLKYKRAKCNWIREEQPEIWEKTHKYLALPGYLTYKLTGKFVDSSPSVVGFVPIDVKTRAWREPTDVAMPIFPVPREKLCDLVDSGDVMGYITAEAMEATGLKEGIPVYGGAADKACEVVGMGCTKLEQAAVSFGTMATIDFSAPEYWETMPGQAPFQSAIKGWFSPELELYRGYWLVSWFQKEFGQPEYLEAAESGKSAIELLNEKMAQIPAGCDGLMFQPYLTPGFGMPFAKGGWVGLADHHTRVHMYRAILEGINYALMDKIEAAETAGNFKIAELRIGGGGSKSTEICQMTANMFGIPVVRVHTNESSALGCAMGAFIGMGEYADYEEAAENMVHMRDRFEPDAEEHALYQTLYNEVYKEIFGKLAPLYGKLEEILKK